MRGAQAEAHRAHQPAGAVVVDGDGLRGGGSACHEVVLGYPFFTTLLRGLRRMERAPIRWGIGVLGFGGIQGVCE